MEFEQVLKNRVSVRSYNGKSVTQEQIDKILIGMRHAPTARHLEAYKVKVSVGDEGFAERLGEITGQYDRIKGCGAIFVFFAVPNDSKYGEKSLNLFPVQDATLACAYAQLAATDLGLQTLWMGAFDDDEVKKLCTGSSSDGLSSLGLKSASLKPTSILIVGYSDEKPELSSRKNLREILL
jgi:nitroreductase